MERLCRKTDHGRQSRYLNRRNSWLRNFGVGSSINYAVTYVKNRKATGVVGLPVESIRCTDTK